MCRGKASDPPRAKCRNEPLMHLAHPVGAQLVDRYFGLTLLGTIRAADAALGVDREVIAALAGAVGDQIDVMKLQVELSGSLPFASVHICALRHG